MRIPARPPDFPNIAQMERGRLERLIDALKGGPAPDGRYRHWDTFRRMRPPEGLSPEEGWTALKMARTALYRTLSLRDRAGLPFKYALVDPVLERLSRIDREAAGRIALPEQATSPEGRDRYIVSSLVEEAITSSQLEGAATTRDVAKEMIRTGRAPRDRSERMILNNYRAMQHIRTRVEDPLTPALVLDLHRITTEGIRTDDGEVARLRLADDAHAVYSDQDQILHRPPPADQLEERMARMCAFANEAETGVFLHPAIKAIILHFWLAYDHPFTDGNGRTARALFYWCMLREGFWLAEYLSISRILKNAPARYGRAFLYTETDDNDLTYFILHQLRTVEQAIEELRSFLSKKVRELQEAKALLHPSSALNHRQIALLGHAVRHAGRAYTIESHRSSHAVAYATARADLLDLADKGLLEPGKQGKRFVFQAPLDLSDRLRRL